MPVRSRWRTHPDGRGARGRLEGDVRRFPPRVGGADRRAPGPVRPGGRLRQLCGREAAGRRHAVVPGVPRDRAARGQPGRQTGQADHYRAGQPEEPDRAAPYRTGRRQALPGLAALPGRGHRGRAAQGRGHLQRELRQRARLGRPGRQVRRDRGRCGGRAAAPGGQARTGYLPGRGPGARRARPMPRWSTRMRWPGWRRAGPGTSATWSAWTGPARPTRCAHPAPMSWSATWPICWRTDDQAPVVPGRPVVPARVRTAPRHAGPDRVAVRPGQRAYRLAGRTWTRASRTASPGRT